MQEIRHCIIVWQTSRWGSPRGDSLAGSLLIAIFPTKKTTTAAAKFLIILCLCLAVNHLFIKIGVSLNIRHVSTHLFPFPLKKPFQLREHGLMVSAIAA